MMAPMRVIRAASYALLVFILPAAAGESREPATGETATVPALSPAELRSDRLDRLLAKLHRLDDSDEAQRTEAAIWALWMSSDSPTAEVLIGQAAAAMNNRRFAPALAILDRLVETDPDFAEAWNKRATLYFMMGRYEESLADIVRVLDLEPRHFGALSGRGMIYQRQKNYAAALAAFREALVINPNMADVKDAVKALERLEQGI